MKVYLTPRGMKSDLRKNKRVLCALESKLTRKICVLVDELLYLTITISKLLNFASFNLDSINNRKYE